MRKRFNAIHMLLAVVGGMALSVALLAAAVGPGIFTVAEALGAARWAFVGDYDADAAVDGLMSGLVSRLDDRWSYYLDAQQTAQQAQRRTNTYVGIGVTVSFEDEGGLLLQDVVKDGPAHRAGLRAGELITHVDGTSVAGEERYNGADLITGEAGTQVLLRVRNARGEDREVEVTRAAIPVEPVESELLAGGVGYIRLKNFYDGSAQKLSAAADELMERGATALVFDMRENGGGYVRELTDMLDHLLPEGPIFRSQSRVGPEYVAKSDEAQVDLPMAVLVNANTYSAAEFFAAELQEMVGAKIVGEPTSGKGYSQQSIALPNGGSLNLSTARYMTGEGVSLIGTGVTLDAQVTLTAEQAASLQAGRLDYGNDPQLQKALELLRD